MADRAVSTTLGYVLTLAMVTVVVGGLFATTADLVGDQRERSIRSELTVVGNRIAADLAAVDRLATASNGSGIVRLSTPLPDQVASTQYEIEISKPGDVVEILLETDEPEVEVTVTVKVANGVDTSTLGGGDIVITYAGTAIEVKRG